MADRGFKKSSDGATGGGPQLEFWGATAIHGLGSVGHGEAVHIHGPPTPKTKMGVPWCRARVFGGPWRNRGVWEVTLTERRGVRQPPAWLLPWGHSPNPWHT